MLIGALALLPLLSGCQKHEKTRVKLEVVVDDNVKVFHGSSIQEYACRETTHIMSDMANCYITGETVIVKIGGRGDLFMVLDRPGARSSTEIVWSVLGAVSDSPMTATNSTLPKSWPLKPEQMPLLVRFSDPVNAYGGGMKAVNNQSFKMQSTAAAIGLNLLITASVLPANTMAANSRSECAALYNVVDLYREKIIARNERSSAAGPIATLRSYEIPFTMKATADTGVSEYQYYKELDIDKDGLNDLVIQRCGSGADPVCTIDVKLSSKKNYTINTTVSHLVRVRGSIYAISVRVGKYSPLSKKDVVFVNKLSKHGYQEICVNFKR